jgi:hypothetical protein
LTAHHTAGCLTVNEELRNAAWFTAEKTSNRGADNRRTIHARTLYTESDRLKSFHSCAARILKYFSPRNDLNES